MLVLLLGELASHTFGRLYYRHPSTLNRSRKKTKPKRKKTFSQSAKLTVRVLHVSLPDANS